MDNNLNSVNKKWCWGNLAKTVYFVFIVLH